MEYKFKLFDNDNNTFDYVSFNDLEHMIEMLRQYEDYFSYKYFIEVPPLLMSSEKDNYGKQIYEGDIIQTYCYDKIQKHIVKLDDKGFHAGRYSLDSIYFKGGGKDFRIIGNVYQNPELVEEINTNKYER